jgi:CDP-glucose 4,6-dehydratase
MSTFQNVFEGKTVLVTGDTGFKGPWLCVWLLQLGANVIGYSLPADGQSSLYQMLDLDDHISHIDGDIRDFDHVNAVMRDYKPEFVFHMAAQSLVRRSYEDPLYTFSTNISGTLNVLEAARLSSSVHVVINVTTDKVYMNKEWEYAYRENDPLGGHDPYSASKACADLLSSVYQQTAFAGKEMGLASVRAGNVFGGGDWAADRLVPDIVRAYQHHRPIEIRNPLSVRPWQYVLEPLSGYLHLASKLYHSPQQYTGGWNFGPGTANALSVGEFVNRFLQNWPENQVLIKEDVDAPPEANLLRLDCTKAASLLGWIPSLTLDEALQRTAVWYQSELSRDISFGMAVDYINDYTSISRSRSACWTAEQNQDHEVAVKTKFSLEGLNSR